MLEFGLDNWFGSEFDVWMVELSLSILIEWNFEVLDTQILIWICLMVEIGLDMIYTWFRTCRKHQNGLWVSNYADSKICIIMQHQEARAERGTLSHAEPEQAPGLDEKFFKTGAGASPC